MIEAVLAINPNLGYQTAQEIERLWLEKEGQFPDEWLEIYWQQSGGEMCRNGRIDYITGSIRGDPEQKITGLRLLTKGLCRLNPAPPEDITRVARLG